MADYSFELSERDIHVWVLRITASHTLASQFEPILSADELDRAKRFRFEHLQQSFAITRGALRHLLGRYLGVAPHSIQFRYGLRGKPAVASATGIEFNITHSENLALVALTVKCPIGIDIERIRPIQDMQSVAERFFSADESREILSLPVDDRELAFFSCWARKEAYIKAIGHGLHVGLDSFRVTVRPNEAARLVHVTDEPNAPDEWSLEDFHLSPQYTAALAYRDRKRSVFVLPEINPDELVHR